MVLDFVDLPCVYVCVCVTPLARVLSRPHSQHQVARCDLLITIVERKLAVLRSSNSKIPLLVESLAVLVCSALHCDERSLVDSRV